MLAYLYSNIFDSPAQVLVNTVNTDGVMGKGIAKHFKGLYPKMFKEYKALCDRGALEIGKLHLWKGPERWVLNFPTKTTWRLPSRLSYIEQGLETFLQSYEDMGFSSISFPPLGCGNGGLGWADVQPIMERYLRNLNVQVFIHNVHVGEDFVPEHKEGPQAPTEFMKFWDDVLASVYRHKGMFHAAGLGDFEVRLQERDLKFEVDLKDSLFTSEHAESLWLALRDGLLSPSMLPSEIQPDLVDYLFPVLKQLPYIRETSLQNFEESHSPVLFFDRSTQKTLEANGSSEDQKWLFQ